MRNPSTKFIRSKNVLTVTSVALIIVHDWPRLVQPFVQSLIGSPGTGYPRHGHFNFLYVHTIFTIHLTNVTGIPDLGGPLERT